MIRKFLFIPLLLVLAGAASFCPDAQWRKYTSGPGGFSIDFPAAVKEDEEDRKMDGGGTFKIHYLTCAVGEEQLYMASWINMNTFYPKSKSIKQILEDSRDGALGTIKAETSETVAIVTNGETPYIEFTFNAAGMSGKDRIYVVNKFQYSILTICAAGKPVSADANQFIHSFHVGQ